MLVEYRKYSKEQRKFSHRTWHPGVPATFPVSVAVSWGKKDLSAGEKVGNCLEWGLQSCAGNEAKSPGLSLLQGCCHQPHLYAPVAQFSLSWVRNGEQFDKMKAFTSLVSDWIFSKVMLEILLWLQQMSHRACQVSPKFLKIGNLPTE